MLMDPVTLTVMKPALNPLFLNFEKLYWIDFPLYIGNMAFDDEGKKAEIFVEYHKKAVFPCACGRTGLKVHDRLQREWRALDIGSYQTVIHLAVPRIKCPECGVRIIKVGWARDHSRFTYLMEERIMLLSQYMPLSNVAKFLNVSETRIVKVIERLQGQKPLKHRLSAAQWAALKREIVLNAENMSYFGSNARGPKNPDSGSPHNLCPDASGSAEGASPGESAAPPASGPDSGLSPEIIATAGDPDVSPEEDER